MKFPRYGDWMVGRKVTYHDPDHPEDADTGIVTGKAYNEDGVWVEWENGSNLWAELSMLDFPDLPYMSEITIDGRRYQLVPIEEKK